MHRNARIGMGALVALAWLGTSGCPSSTTLPTDAAGLDAPGLDAGSDGGTPATWDECTVPSDCLLVNAGCCSACGTPTASDFDAVAQGHMAEHFLDVCPTPIPCPRCATGTNPSLVPTCQAAHCAVTDLSMLPLSACAVDADCVVRWANCCSCSGDTLEVVSIRGDADAAMQALLCDAGTCPLDCATSGDATFRAVCDPTTLHCAAVPL